MEKENTPEIELEIRAKELWHEIESFLTTDLAYIWTPKIKKDIKKITGILQRIEHYLIPLSNSYSPTDSSYEKKRKTIEELLEHLRHPLADKQWVIYIHDRLMELTSPLNAREVQRIKNSQKSISTVWMQAISPQNHADIPPELISAAETEISKALSEILLFYRTEGTPLKIIPKIKTVNEFCKFNPALLAVTIAEQKTYLEMVSSRYFLRLMTVFYAEVCGIILTPEVLAEFTKKGVENLSRIGMVYGFSDADILVFRPLLQNPTALKTTLAHELWHLIELEKFGTVDFLIREGTATYAQYYFENCPIPAEPAYKLFYFLYNEIGKMVEKHIATLPLDEVRRSQKPLKRLLSKKVRKEILRSTQEQFEQFVPRFLWWESRQLDMLYLMTASHREFHLLRGNLTKERLVYVYRLRGYPAFAELLLKSNTQRFLDAFRKIGF